MYTILAIAMLLCLVAGAVCFMVFDNSESAVPGWLGAVFICGACTAAFCIGHL